MSKVGSPVTKNLIGGVHDFGNNSIRKAKTDKADAVKIASLCALNSVISAQTSFSLSPFCGAAPLPFFPASRFPASASVSSSAFLIALYVLCPSLKIAVRNSFLLMKPIPCASPKT